MVKNQKQDQKGGVSYDLLMIRPPAWPFIVGVVPVASCLSGLSPATFVEALTGQTWTNDAVPVIA
jgi:hypothetical protein